MRKFVKRISLPLLIFVGLALVGMQTAEGAKWRRHARHAYVQPYYVAAPVVYAPRVRVYAPGVGVQVGPGVHVRAPGVRVNIGGWYPHRYGW